MKSIRLQTILSTLLFTLGVLAARSYPALAQGQDEKAGGVGPGSMPTVEDQLKDLTEKLNLTDDQQSKIKPLLEDERQQMQTKDNSLSPQDRMSRLRRIQVTTSSKIRELLNDEQQVKFDQMEKERRNRERSELEKRGEVSPK
ncbi:MAG TPA: hypothetical protein VI636_05545 [Candidatus Angelobacter sp.]